MATSSQIVTAEELFRMPSGMHRYELIRGELHTMSPTGGEHGEVVVELTLLLAGFIKQNRLGKTLGAETGFLLECNPDTVLAPDFAFVGRDRVPESGIPKKFVPFPPDLAVEVLSPDDFVAKAKRKAEAWLEHGAREVWLVDPKKRTVSIYCTGKQVVLLTEADSLTSDLLPGFSCRVSEVFAPLSEAS
jgi:Uma2 family endonuclease